jgi:hypothetical protein
MAVLLFMYFVDIITNININQTAGLYEVHI